MDSYGQFQTKAKTRPCRDTKNPEWNEEFELEVDGAMTLRILCYDRAREASAGASYDDDVLIAKGKVGVSIFNNHTMYCSLVFDVKYAFARKHTPASLALVKCNRKYGTCFSRNRPVSSVA